MNFMGLKMERNNIFCDERNKDNKWVECNRHVFIIHDVPFDKSINYDIVKIKQIVKIAFDVFTKEKVICESVCYIDRGGAGGFSRDRGDDETITEKIIVTNFLKSSNIKYKSYVKNRKKYKKDKFIIKALDDMNLVNNIYYNYQQCLKEV